MKNLNSNPNNQQAWSTLFQACYQIGNFTPALDLVGSLIDRIDSPEDNFFKFAQSLHVHGYQDEAVSLYNSILEYQPEARRTLSALIGHYQLYGDEARAHRAYALWNERFAIPVGRKSTPAKTSAEPGRPLRIGIASNDFGGTHSLIAVIRPWFLSAGDREGEYIFYSNGQAKPPHKFFVDAADVFVDISAMDDDALDRRIRADRIDILVDMISHTGRCRLLVYARKPAPIIVSWVGLGIPTGVDAVDYFLACEDLVPRNTTALYHERIAYIPRASIPWEPPAVAPAVRPPPSSHQDGVVFGNLTRIVKISRQTIDLWARVLREVSDSKLLLKDPNLRGAGAQRILSIFQELGISEDRLILREGTSQAEHMATYNEVDIALDTAPQSGGVSTWEALWMGVPVISLCHPTKPSGRIGRYIFENIGMSALAVDGEDEFVGLSALLANGPDQLVALRRSLRQALAQSPICDADEFHRNISSAFRMMWTRYCDGREPETFSVSDT